MRLFSQAQNSLGSGPSCYLKLCLIFFFFLSGFRFSLLYIPHVFFFSFYAVLVQESIIMSDSCSCIYFFLRCAFRTHRHNGCQMKVKKILCQSFITLNNFPWITQDHVYRMHLSFFSSTARQRCITVVFRFKDFPTWAKLVGRHSYKMRYATLGVFHNFCLI